MAVAETGYTIRAPDLKLEVAQLGTVALAIVPAPGHWVDLRAPVRISLVVTGAAGVQLGKRVLGHADVAQPGHKTLRFSVPIQAAKAGNYEVSIDTRFWLCRKRVCWPLQRNMNVGVAVKPAKSADSIGQDQLTVE